MYNQLYILAGKHFMNAETCKKQILMAAWMGGKDKKWA
jgi:hypothetical protein